MNKMVINHLEKLFVTNDAATIIRELEVEHPAAKMMILGSQMMEQEVLKLLKPLYLITDTVIFYFM
jgi:T-complex protein 1 subunit theta